MNKISNDTFMVSTGRRVTDNAMAECYNWLTVAPAAIIIPLPISTDADMIAEGDRVDRFPKRSPMRFALFCEYHYGQPIK
jgi:hypothetical protein